MATLPEVVITATPDSYAAQQSGTAVRVDVPLARLPLAVGEAPQPLLQDRGVQRTDRALDTVSSVQRDVLAANGYGFIVRGFDDAGATLLDGFREDGGLSDAQSVERVEVVKGPASALYGSSNSGGTVDVISKRPEEDRFTRVSLGGGSLSHARATVDANADTGAGVLLRLNGSLDTTDTSHPYNHNRTATLAPALTWTPTDQDSVTLLARFIASDYTQDAYSVPAIRQVLGLKLSQSFTGPGLGASRDAAARLALLYTHRFSDSVEYRLDVAGSLTSERLGTDNIGQFALSPDGATLSRTILAGPQQSLDLQVRNELAGRLRTGAVAHELLAGLDVLHVIASSKTSAASLPALNLANPVLGGPPGPFSPDQDTDVQAIDLGLYVQDYATWGRWHGLVGARADGIYVQSLDRLSGDRFDDPAGGLSPRVGLAFDVTAGTAVYANLATSLIPNVSSHGEGGRPLPPTHAVQQEVGVKRRMLGGGLVATAAVYAIQKTGIAVPELSDPTISVPGGRQESRGVELELTGRLAPGWNVAVSYAHTAARFTGGADIAPSRAVPGVPRDAAGLWSSYEFARGVTLAGWGGGLGVRAQTAREATLPNTFRLPAFARLDAAVWRRLELGRTPMRLQIELTNLTGARTFDTDGNAFLRPNEPRSVFASASAEF